MVSSLKVLFSSIVDYAGLFPPAKLRMSEAIENYIQYQSGPFAWMLGSFLLPVSRRQEFLRCTQQVPAGGNQIFRWPIGLIFPRSGEAIPSSFDFNQLDFMGIEHDSESNQAHRYLVKSIDFPPLSIENLEKIINSLPKDKELYFEVPLDRDIEAHLIQIKSSGHSAKVRLGGVTPDAFPRTKSLGRFLKSAARMKVPFKATAGLHYLVPGTHPVTSLEHSLNANMQGFLNLAIASAILNCKASQDVIDILEKGSLDSFHFDEDGVTIKNWPQSRGNSDFHLSLMDLLESRRYFFRSFGSCSFELPVTGLREVMVC